MSFSIYIPDFKYANSIGNIQRFTANFDINVYINKHNSKDISKRRTKDINYYAMCISKDNVKQIKSINDIPNSSKSFIVIVEDVTFCNKNNIDIQYFNPTKYINKNIIFIFGHEEYGVVDYKQYTFDEIVTIKTNNTSSLSLNSAVITLSTLMVYCNRPGTNI